jgi:site-specific DNA-methyltransferase (adenine-specific)
MLIHKAKKPAYFDVPYLEEERSEAWKKRLNAQEKHKPKSNNLRRSNVFSDINELFRNKHVFAEKPTKLYEVLIKTSCPFGGLVIDPCAGSGTTAVVCKKLKRKYICIEKDLEIYNIMINRITGNKNA